MFCLFFLTTLLLNLHVIPWLKTDDFGPNTNRIFLDGFLQPMTVVIKCGKLLENIILVLCPLYTYTDKNTPLLVGYTMFLNIN